MAAQTLRPCFVEFTSHACLLSVAKPTRRDVFAWSSEPIDKFRAVEKLEA